MPRFLRLFESSGLVVVLVLLLQAACCMRQAASCTENEFTCNSSKCISKDLTCDGEDDCGDFSDEINCTNRGKCNLEEFECSGGACISSSLVCNGKWECPRGLDEVNCESKTTAPTTSSFEQRGLFHTVDGETKYFPVYEKSQGISIYFRFTARRCAGHLFEMTSQNTDQFFLLSLTGNGNIEFLFKTSSGPGVIVIPPPPGGSFCNGKMHMLAIRRYLDELRYRVNRGRSVTTTIGLLRQPFSRPFRVYVGMNFEGCVSGIDVIFYRTRSEVYSVGVSKGCAKIKKTTPLPLDKIVSTLRLITPTFRTRMRKESVDRTSSQTPRPTLAGSKQVLFTKDVTSKGTQSQTDTTATQHVRVTHSRSVTSSSSASGTFTMAYTSQGAHAQTSSLVTQSQDIMDPHFVDLGKISTHSKSTSTLPIKHVTSASNVSESRSTTSKDLISTTLPISSTLIPTSFQHTTNEISKDAKCEPLHSTFCAHMGYSQTSLPNRVGHKSQIQAEKQMSRFLPFIRANCSNALKDFICATYLQPCSSPQFPIVKPCRELCLMSKHECAPLMKAFEFSWPESLDCHELPSIAEEDCIIRHDTKIPVVLTQTTQIKGLPEITKIRTSTVFPSILVRKTETPSRPAKSSRCGGILTRPSGIIQSPNFPKSYPSDTLCKWAIILPKVYHVIDVTLEEASLEADANCGYDYLLFLDGLSNQVGPRVCGFLAYPRVVTIKGNMAFIVFRSDSALNKKGVLIKYKAHCLLSCSGNNDAMVNQLFVKH